MYACRVSKLLVLSGYRPATHTSPLFLLFFFFFSILFPVSFPFVCSFFSCYMYVSIKNIDRTARQIDKALNKHIFLGAKTNWIVVVGRCRSSSSFPLSSHHHITSRWSNLHTYDVFHILCVILLVCVRTSHTQKWHTVKSNSRNRSIEEERISSVVDGEYTSRRRSLFNHHHHHL